MTDRGRRRRALADRPRSERAAEVAALRDQGMTWNQITSRLSISRSYAIALFSDPDGSRDRARKAGYGRPCRVCGKTTDGSNGRAKAPEICIDCARVANAPEHGTASKYRKGCRCVPCTAANRESVRALRHAGRTPKTHGYSGYINYGCRCEVCTRANTEYSSTYGIVARRRKRAAA